MENNFDLVLETSRVHIFIKQVLTEINDIKLINDYFFSFFYLYHGFCKLINVIIYLHNNTEKSVKSKLEFPGYNLIDLAGFLKDIYKNIDELMDKPACKKDYEYFCSKTFEDFIYLINYTGNVKQPYIRNKDYEQLLKKFIKNNNKKLRKNILITMRGLSRMFTLANFGDAGKRPYIYLKEYGSLMDNQIGIKPENKTIKKD